MSQFDPAATFKPVEHTDESTRWWRNTGAVKTRL